MRHNVELGGVVERHEIDKPDPVGEDAGEPHAGIQCETGLADTRRTGQREQPSRPAGEQLANQLQLVHAADEGRRVCFVVGSEDG